MKEATWLIAAVLALGLGAVAAHEDKVLQGDELQQAHHSRDFAARKVCQGQAFEWADDKTLVCFKERQP